MYFKLNVVSTRQQNSVSSLFGWKFVSKTCDQKFMGVNLAAKGILIAISNSKINYILEYPCIYNDRQINEYWRSIQIKANDVRITYNSRISTTFGFPLFRSEKAENRLDEKSGLVNQPLSIDGIRLGTAQTVRICST